MEHFTSSIGVCCALAARGVFPSLTDRSLLSHEHPQCRKLTARANKRPGKKVLHRQSSFWNLERADKVIELTPYENYWRSILGGTYEHTNERHCPRSWGVGYHHFQSPA